MTDLNKAPETKPRTKKAPDMDKMSARLKHTPSSNKIGEERQPLSSISEPCHLYKTVPSQLSEVSVHAIKYAEPERYPQVFSSFCRFRTGFSVKVGCSSVPGVNFVVSVEDSMAATPKARQ